MLRVLLVLTALLLAGCLEADETIRLEADGSGTLDLSFTIDLSARDALLEAAVALLRPDDEVEGSGRDAAPFANPVCVRWFRELAVGVEGYEIQSAEERVEDGRYHVRIQATFASLEAAEEAGAFFPFGLELERAGREAWRFTAEDAWHAAARTANGEVAGRPLADLVAALADPLQGLRLARTFVFPTPVSETNAERGPDARTVIWRVGRDGLAQGARQPLVVTFAKPEAPGLHPVRRRPDLDALVHRLFEKPPGMLPAGVDPVRPTPSEEGEAR